ncbi:MAG: hypothetical protein C4346_08535, partial [Chloroflexota bacterium]
EGLVERIVYPEVPVRIEYRLTEKGRALDQVMDAVATWAHRWLAPESGSATSVTPEERRARFNEAAETELAKRH